MNTVVLATILAASSVTQAPIIEGDPALFDLLRDAQATNSARLRSGKMTATIAIRAGSNKARIVEEIEWSGADFRASYQIVDPAGFVQGVASPEDDLAKAPTHRLLVAGHKVYGLSIAVNAVYVNDSRSTSVRYFELAPQDSWFRAFPPQGRQGRPWVELIGPHPAFPAKNVEGYAISREGADLIKQVRRLKGGATSESLFSIDSCMNVVKHTGLIKGPNGVSRWLDYRWRRDPDGACVLDELEAKEGPSTDPRQAEFHYQLHVDSIDIKHPIDSSRFTLASFVSDLRNVKVIDRGTGKTTFMNVDPNRKSDDLSKLAEQLRSRGFAKP